MQKSVNATIDTLIRWKSIYSLIGYTEDLEIINSTIDILKNYDKAIKSKEKEKLRKQRLIKLNYHGLYCNESIRKMIYKKRRLLKRFKENQFT